MVTLLARTDASVVVLCMVLMTLRKTALFLFCYRYFWRLWVLDGLKFTMLPFLTFKVSSKINPTAAAAVGRCRRRQALIKLFRAMNVLRAADCQLSVCTLAAAVNWHSTCFSPPKNPLLLLPERTHLTIDARKHTSLPLLLAQPYSSEIWRMVSCGNKKPLKTK